MDVVQSAGIFSEVSRGFCSRVIQVTCIQAKARYLVRNITGHLLNLVGKLNISACVRMDDWP